MINIEVLKKKLEGIDLNEEKNLDQFLAQLNDQLNIYLSCKKEEGAYRLPRDGQGNLLRRFKLNDHQYYLLTEDTGTSVARYELFKKLSLSFSFTADFQTFINEIQGIEKEAFEAIRTPSKVQNLLQRTQRMKDAVIDLSSQEKQNYCKMIFAAMTVREDEDAVTIDEKIFQEKLEAFEVLAIQDLYFFLKHLIGGFKEYYQAEREAKLILAKELEQKADTNTNQSNLKKVSESQE